MSGKKLSCQRSVLYVGESINFVTASYGKQEVNHRDKEESFDGSAPSPPNTKAGMIIRKAI